MRHIRISSDRYLICRDGIYQYHRRVPRQLEGFDERAPVIRKSLQTDDILTARRKRDMLERADDEYWGAMITGDIAPHDAKARYDDAVRRATALGFSYRTSRDISELPLDEIVRRVTAVMNENTPPATVRAVLGTVNPPKLTFTEVLEIYEKTIKAVDLSKKSVRQRVRWKGKCQWAIEGFHAVNGVVDIGSITREMALAYRSYWLNKVLPPEDEPDVKPKSVGTANRAIGSLRRIYREYYKHIGQPDRENPFRDLSFSEKGSGKTRPPFSVEWIVGKLLVPGALARMNEEERGIFLALIETGARAIELCNLTADDIAANAPIPYIHIRPSSEPGKKHELKTESSMREVPLVGVALEVFRRFPNGFPRYRDNSSSFSASANKFLQENGLLQTPEHTVYSLRHAFEDRMKKAKIDLEIRTLLVGHKISRPRYG